LNFEQLQLDHPAEKVLQVVVNRPRQFNALNRYTIQELHSAMELFEDSSDEFFILSGSGRAFCFGADFTEFENRDGLPQLLSLFQNLILKIFHCSKITVAKLNGFATGAGLDLALACDFRCAAEKIKLGEAYISMGLVPDGGGTFFLPRMIGISRALELLIRGDSITAEEAKDLGLIHRVFPANELDESTLKYVLEMAGKPKTARQLIKKLVKTPASSLEEALNREKESQLICFNDPDHLRLAEEFLNKRKK
jgi:2-(1,2-epoxy-1,2-dihydrophenyl)acetyl-CoA isomerase